ncbi:hypothetical protein LCGC14_3020740, partial [marine sediment metagenome]
CKTGGDGDQGGKRAKSKERYLLKKWGPACQMARIQQRDREQDPEDRPSPKRSCHRDIRDIEHVKPWHLRAANCPCHQKPGHKHSQGPMGLHSGIKGK